MTQWIVPVRAGENEELRYAIRTWVANGGLKRRDQLFVVGDLPEWIKGVEYIPGNRMYDAPRNVYDNIRLACDEVPGEAIVVNDDFFFLRRLDPRRIGARGTLADHISITNQNTPWGKSLRSTMKFLQRQAGIQEPLSYELHRPLLIDTHGMAKSLRIAERVTPTNPPQWRTLYGNLYSIEAEIMPDGKVYREGDECASDVLSTTDRSWEMNALAKKIPQMFTRKSRFEK